VYIQEAHAKDEWDIQNADHTLDGHPVDLPQITSEAEHTRRARDFALRWGLRGGMTVPNCTFMDLFKPWPMRIVRLRVHKGEVTFLQANRVLPGGEIDMSILLPVHH